MAVELSARDRDRLDQGETVHLIETTWACAGCRADVYLRQIGDVLDCRIAHDNNCGSLRRIRAFEDSLIRAAEARNN